MGHIAKLGVQLTRNTLSGDDERDPMSHASTYLRDMEQESEGGPFVPRCD